MGSVGVAAIDKFGSGRMMFSVSGVTGKHGVLSRCKSFMYLLEEVLTSVSGRGRYLDCRYLDYVLIISQPLSPSTSSTLNRF